MSALLLMVIISLTLAGGFLGAFLWAVTSGQFKDSRTPGLRILHEQPPVRTGSKHRKDKEHNHD